MLEINKIYNEDCLEGMRKIEDKSIDMILTDLPYGTTSCKWDIVIPLDLLWSHYERIIKEDGAILLFGSEPFSSLVRVSNLKLFKYDWIWKKNKPGNINQANTRPMKYHENISVFYKKNPTFNKQMIERSEDGKKKVEQYQRNSVTFKGGFGELNGNENYKEYDAYKYSIELKNPSDILEFKKDYRPLHVAQKPVSLYEYFINTYTNQGELILDSCCGSGTIGIACRNMSRNFIGFEKDEKFFKIACERIGQNY